MKKVLAIVLALVMAFSMSAMAFAYIDADADGKCDVCGKAASEFTTGADGKADLCKDTAQLVVSGGDQTTHVYTDPWNTCGKCGAHFESEAEFNKHVAACTVGDVVETTEKDYVDLTVKEILNMIIDLAKSGMAQWDAIESVVIRLVDFIENIGSAAIPQADVEGAVADLESALAPLKSADKDGLLDALKAKIKALYAGEKATTEAESTTAEAPAETGSASVGIAVFAAVSVAAAAAYVCTKKKA